MVGQSASERPETEPTGSGVDSDECGADAGRGFSPWVTFYAFLHRHTGSPVIVFGSSVMIGSLVLVRQFYAFASEPTEWSGLPPWAVLFGVFLFGLGVGYFVVRAETSCSACGGAFTVEQVARRPVRRETGDSSQVFIEETDVCRTCETRTTDVYTQRELEHYKW